MPYTYPTIVSDSEYDKAFEYEETLEASSTGYWVMFPTIARGAFVELQTSSGSGYVQTTLDPVHYVFNDIAVVKTWATGTASSTISREYFNPVSAIRAVNVSGTIRLVIRFQ